MKIFPQYNPKDVEARIYKKWVNEGLFNAEIDFKKKPFCVVIPPPNITGILHIGHALNNTIQDVLIRFKRMQGYEALWMPGTDHAGIATQNVVEKELTKEGLRKEDIGRKKFIERLWGWQKEYGSTILQQLKKLGAGCDWRRTRFTMDENYSKTVREVFIRLYRKGLIYRGNYIINWCPRCKTALSDEESPHQEIDGWLYYIRYPVKPVVSRQSPATNYIVVATTRPETMLGDTAVAINPKDKRYKWLKKAEVMLPILNRKLKVIEDDLVDPEFGTGVVKVTPAHDPVDFLLANKHNLELINIMNEDATLNKNAAEFVALDRFKARGAIVEALGKMRLMEKREPYKISAGHCYRCHTIIEPRVSLQWFVKMKPLAKKAIKVVEEDKIKFYPPRWRKVYLNWMDNVQDWCISRQIWWGHRLPVYYCKECLKETGSKLQISNYKSQINPKSKTQNSKQRGIIVSEIKPDKCPDCGSLDLVQEIDVLDTWFSSWLWPFAIFYWPVAGYRIQDIGCRQKKNPQPNDLEYFYPTSVLVTASEILFFWVARMIMSSLEFIGEIPFQDVLIHGTVRDERGIKMSKSLGNTINPLEIIDKFGADCLRFSLMLLAASGSDVYLSDEKFLVGRNFCNKIWNASRFILLKIRERDFKINDLKLDNLDSIDRWIIKELGTTIDKATRYLQVYRLNEAAKTIYEFFWHTFCDWYIEIAKCDFTLPRAKNLLYVIINSLKLLHPFVPFITEEIYQLIRERMPLSLEEYIIKSSWPEPYKYKVKVSEDEVRLKALIETIKEIRNIKSALGLGVKKIILEVRSEETEYWQGNEAWIKHLASLESIQFKEKLGRTLYENEWWELNFCVEDIDRDTFLSSLNKKIEKLGRLFDRANQRLNNNNFLKRASSVTINEERNKLNEFSVQLRRLGELRNAFLEETGGRS